MSKINYETQFPTLFNFLTGNFNQNVSISNINLYLKEVVSSLTESERESLNNEIDNLISDDINDSELHNLLVESFSFANLDNVMKLLSVVTPKDVLEKIKSTLN
jgi:hypothetical protein